MNGGYCMIDCTGLDLILGEVEQSLPGIFAKCTDVMNKNKPVYACNCVWTTGNPVTPIQVMLIKIGDNIIATASTLQIIITPNDTITIVNLVG